jgi:hypothetical protein
MGTDDGACWATRPSAPAFGKVASRRLTAHERQEGVRAGADVQACSEDRHAA